MTAHDFALIVSTTVGVAGVAFGGLGWMLKLVHDIRNDLRSLNGRLAKVEQWQVDHLREMDLRLMTIESRIERCTYTACPVRESRQRGES